MRKFSVQLPGGLKPNQVVKVHGSFHTTVGITSFRFQDTDDFDFENTITFDFGINLNENYTERNSFSNGQWGIIESTDPFPFNKRQAYVISFYIFENAFEISVNDVPYWTFKHRLPLSTAKYLVAMGDIDVNEVEIFGNIIKSINL